MWLQILTVDIEVCLVTNSFEDVPTTVRRQCWRHHAKRSTVVKQALVIICWSFPLVRKLTIDGGGMVRGKYWPLLCRRIKCSAELSKRVVGLLGELCRLPLLIFPEYSDPIVFDLDVLPSEADTSIITGVSKDLTTTYSRVCQYIHERAVSKFGHCL